MKKTLFVLLMLFVASWAFALDGTVTFMWYENDPNVEYYRYQVDGEDDDKWTVLDWSVSEVAVDLDVSVLHLFYLQQSYDGETWSSSSVTESEVYEDVEESPVEEFFEEEFDLWETEEMTTEAEDESIPTADPSEVEFDGLFSDDIIAIERHRQTSDLDLGIGYLNRLPDSIGPRRLGLAASLTHNLIPVGVAELAVKANVGIYSSSDFGIQTYINALATITKEIGNCDVFCGIGPEFGFTVVHDSGVGFGLAVEAGVRYRCAETFSVGFALSDHCLLVPFSDIRNSFDARVFLSKEI